MNPFKVTGRCPFGVIITMTSVLGNSLLRRILSTMGRSLGGIVLAFTVAIAMALGFLFSIETFVAAIIAVDDYSSVVVAIMMNVGDVCRKVIRNKGGCGYYYS